MSGLPKCPSVRFLKRWKYGCWLQKNLFPGKLFMDIDATDRNEGPLWPWRFNICKLPEFRTDNLAEESKTRTQPHGSINWNQKVFHGHLNQWRLCIGLLWRKDVWAEMSVWCRRCWEAGRKGERSEEERTVMWQRVGASGHAAIRHGFIRSYYEPFLRTWLTKSIGSINGWSGWNTESSFSSPFFLRDICLEGSKLYHRVKISLENGKSAKLIWVPAYVKWRGRGEQRREKVTCLNSYLLPLIQLRLLGKLALGFKTCNTHVLKHRWIFFFKPEDVLYF